MELLRENICASREIKREILQITIDDDYNIPDVKPDVSELLWQEANVSDITLRPDEKRVGVSAKFVFDVLYLSNDKEKLLENIMGELPLREMINADMYMESDELTADAQILDLSVRMINSRKLNIKAIINIELVIHRIVTAPVVSDVLTDASKRFFEVKYNSLVAKKADVLRIKENVTLAASKPDVGNILFRSVKLRQRQVRLIDNGFNIRGELAFFIIYSHNSGSRDNKEDIVWYEGSVPFDETVSVNGVAEDMIGSIGAKLSSYTIEVQPDDDGEERVLCVEAVVGLDIRLLEDKEMRMLEDIYNPTVDYDIAKNDIELEKIVVKNESKCSVTGGIKSTVPSESLLQICYVDGKVIEDERELTPAGIVIRGILEVNIIVIVADDIRPVGVIKGQLPFEHTISVPETDGEIKYAYDCYLEKINVNLTGDNEASVKANIVFDTFVTESITARAIDNIEAVEADMKEIMDMPGIIGYIVKDGDTMWNIAKKFRTTTDDIKLINDKSDERISRGEKLIIVKNVR